MLRYFMPDKICDTVYDIDFEGLLKKNIKGLIFDIDNTLVSYKQPEPTAEVTELMDSLKNKGFKICFVSNNKKERVDLFNLDFKFPAFAEAGKPLKKYMNLALEAMGLTAERSAIIGDQLFTDICAGKRLNMLSLFVYPIEPVETLFFKAKRALEKPIVKKYWKMENKLKSEDL